MHTQRGLSIFGLIALMALAAAIAWALLQVVKLPLPKNSINQIYTTETGSVTPPTLMAADSLDASTSILASSSIATSTVASSTQASSTPTTATSTATSTKAKATTKKS